jgi:chitinase
MGKAEGNKPLTTQRRRWVNSIKMDVRKIGLDGMDWIDLAQDTNQLRALVNTEVNLRVS